MGVADCSREPPEARLPEEREDSSSSVEVEGREDSSRGFTFRGSEARGFSSFIPKEEEEVFRYLDLLFEGEAGGVDIPYFFKEEEDLVLGDFSGADAFFIDEPAVGDDFLLFRMPPEGPDY